MFFGSSGTSSVTHAAGSPDGGTSASPNTLVVLVQTNAVTPEATASSSRLSVPVMLTSTKSWRLWVPTGGLSRAAVCNTAPTPFMQRPTKQRSVIGPQKFLNAPPPISIPSHPPHYALQFGT